MDSTTGIAAYLGSANYFFEYVYSHAKQSSMLQDGNGNDDGSPELTQNFFGPNNVHLYFPEEDHPTHGVLRTLVKDSGVTAFPPGSDVYPNIWLDSDGRIGNNTARGSAVARVAGAPSTDLYDGLWHMITVTSVDTGGYAMYVDGNFVASNEQDHADASTAFDFADATGTANQPIMICGRTDLHPLRHFHGRVAQLSVYDHSLERSDVGLLYHAVPLLSDASLMPASEPSPGRVVMDGGNDEAQQQQQQLGLLPVSPRYEKPRPVAYFPLTHESSRGRSAFMPGMPGMPRYTESVPIPGMAAYDPSSKPNTLVNASDVYLGELHGNARFVRDTAFGRALQCHEGSGDYVAISTQGSTGGRPLVYGERDGQFAINLWFKRTVGHGNAFEYLFSHGGSSSATADVVFNDQTASYSFGPNQVQAFVPEASHPAHGVIRTIVKDATDSATVSFLDSDGRYNDNTARDLTGHVDTDDGRWHMYTLTTFASEGDGPRKPGYLVYIDGMLAGVVSETVKEQYTAAQRAAGLLPGDSMQGDSRPSWDPQGKKRHRRALLHGVDYEHDHDYAEDYADYDYPGTATGSPYDPLDFGDDWMDREFDASYRERSDEIVSMTNPFARLPYAVDGGDAIRIAPDAPIYLCGRSDGHPERHFGGRIARVAVYDQSLRHEDVMRLYLAAPLHLEANLRQQEADEEAMRETQLEALANDEGPDDVGTSVIKLPPRAACSPDTAARTMESCTSGGTTTTQECCQALFDAYGDGVSPTYGCMCYVSHTVVEIPSLWANQATLSVEWGREDDDESFAFCSSRVAAIVAEANRNTNVTMTVARQQQLMVLCGITGLFQRTVESCSARGYALPTHFGGPFAMPPQQSEVCYATLGEAGVSRAGLGGDDGGGAPSTQMADAAPDHRAEYGGGSLQSTYNSMQVVPSEMSGVPLEGAEGGTESGGGAGLSTGAVLGIALLAAAVAMALAWGVRKWRVGMRRRAARRFVEMEGFGSGGDGAGTSTRAGSDPTLWPDVAAVPQPAQWSASATTDVPPSEQPAQTSASTISQLSDVPPSEAPPASAIAIVTVEPSTAAVDTGAAAGEDLDALEVQTRRGRRLEN